MPRRIYRKTYRKRNNRSQRRSRVKQTRRTVKTHFFKRTKVQEIAITNAGFVTIANQHQLDSMPSYTEFTNLYDKYKICRVKQRFIFNRNSAEVVSATAELPHLITVMDPNDSTVLADETEALQYTSFRSVRLNKPIKRYYRPTIQPLSITSSSGWLPTANATTAYHGMKIAVDTINSATGTTLGHLRVYTTYYIACRVPR